jgi:3-hydroxybutyryl-CoA dehydrogenase
VTGRAADDPVRPVRAVTVVGSGLMGSGIAQVSAQAGYDVTVVDTSVEALDGARARIEDSLGRFVRSGKLTEDQASAARQRLTMTTELEPAARAADLVVEAIVEDLEPKVQLFAQLDEWCAPDVVLATNTSQYRIGLVAQRTSRPDRVIGMHWSNPPPLMMLVEIVLGDATSTTVLEATQKFLQSCDRKYVVCRKDVPGFISNRMSTVLFMEAVRLVDEGIADPHEVDDVARLMYGHRMGPLTTLDLAGLDTALRVSTALTEHYGGDRFAPPATLERLVAEGRFGRKSGAGFYEYDS